MMLFSSVHVGASAHVTFPRRMAFTIPRILDRAHVEVQGAVLCAQGVLPSLNDGLADWSNGGSSLVLINK